MTLEDIKARVGGSIKRRYKTEKWKDVEVKNEDYAHYYFDLTNHGYEYQL
jgi:hypothetical protein